MFLTRLTTASSPFDPIIGKLDGKRYHITTHDDTNILRGLFILPQSETSIYIVFYILNVTYGVNCKRRIDCRLFSMNLQNVVSFTFCFFADWSQEVWHVKNTMYILRRICFSKAIYISLSFSTRENCLLYIPALMNNCTAKLDCKMVYVNFVCNHVSVSCIIHMRVILK